MNFLYKTALNAQQLLTLADNAYPAGSPWQLQTFEQDLANEYTHYMGMVNAQGELIGFAGGTYLDNVLDISNVAIVKAYQGQHLGEVLLRQWFAEFSDGTNVLLEVRESNRAAQYLYQRLGFDSYRRRKAYYNHPVEDAVLMMLTLPIKLKE